MTRHIGEIRTMDQGLPGKQQAQLEGKNTPVPLREGKALERAKRGVLRRHVASTNPSASALRPCHLDPQHYHTLNPPDKEHPVSELKAREQEKHHDVREPYDHDCNISV